MTRRGISNYRRVTPGGPTTAKGSTKPAGDGGGQKDPGGRLMKARNRMEVIIKKNYEEMEQIRSGASSPGRSRKETPVWFWVWPPARLRLAPTRELIRMHREEGLRTFPR